MPDLGLAALSDDQLIALLGEAATEVVTRDPVVQRLAQKTVLSVAEKQQAFMALVKREIESAASNYAEEIRLDVRRDIALAINRGEIKVLSPAAEAEIIDTTVRAERDRLQKELRTSPEKASFSVHYANGTLSTQYTSGGRPWQTQRKIPVDIATGIKVRTAVLGAFGLPTSVDE